MGLTDLFPYYEDVLEKSKEINRVLEEVGRENFATEYNQRRLSQLSKERTKSLIYFNIDFFIKASAFVVIGSDIIYQLQGKASVINSLIDKLF